AFLAAPAPYGHPQIFLHIVPAQWFGGQDIGKATGCDVVPEARQKQVLFVAKLRVKSGSVYTGCSFKVGQRGTSETVLPEHGNRLLHHLYATEMLGPTDRHNVIMLFL